MKTCFNCGKAGIRMFGYTICDSCKSGLRLFSMKTIQKHYAKDPAKFSADMDHRLEFLEKDYIKKKLKLLHVKEQLKKI